MAEAAQLPGAATSDPVNPDLMAGIEDLQRSQQPSADWKARIPQEVRGEKVWDNYKTDADIFKAHANLVKLQGRSVVIPDEKTEPAKVKEFWSKLGLPESPDKYELKRPEKMPDGLTYFEDLEKGFAEHMHKANAPQPFVQAALDYWNNSVAPRLIEGQPSAEEVEAKCKDAWGKESDAMLAAAERFSRAHMDDGLAAIIDALPVDAQVKLNTMFAKLGRNLSEDGAINLTHGSKEVAADSIQKLKSRQAEIFNDPDYTRNNFRHKGLVEEMISINQKLSELQNG